MTKSRISEELDEIIDLMFESVKTQLYNQLYNYYDLSKQMSMIKEDVKRKEFYIKFIDKEYCLKYINGRWYTLTPKQRSILGIRYKS